MKRQTLINLILAIIGVILAITVGVKQNTINGLNVSLLEAKDKPPRIITISSNEIKYTYKDSTVIKIKHAPEGKVEINTELYNKLYSEINYLENQLANVVNDTTYVENNAVVVDSTKVVILRNTIKRLTNMLQTPKQSGLISVQQAGFCLRPIAGIVWDSEVSPMVGAKILFFHEYGLSIVSTPHVGGIAVSRYLNDVVPFLHNTQGTIGIGLPYKKSEGGNIFVGMSVNL